MGSTLGNVSGKLLRISPSFTAGIGLAALFGAASNAPLAMSVLTAELFGLRAFPFALLVCFLSAILSGEKRGIYLTQRVFHHGKNDWVTIEELREIKDNY
jgi:H+/Cl- antiporter ClcA